MSKSKNIFRFGRLKAHGDRGKVQVAGLSGEVHSSINNPQPHGIESKAPLESETFTVYQDGNPDQGATLIIAGKAPIVLDDGDTVVYSAGGATMHCEGANIKITGGTIALNGTAYEGLIKIKDLTTKINLLVTAYNSHQHPGYTIAVPDRQMVSLSATDYENPDVTHG